MTSHSRFALRIASALLLGLLSSKPTMLAQTSTTGKVVGWIDLTGILSPEDHTDGIDVLNGIAYDAKGDRLFVTGKKWPKLFEIKLVKKK